MELIPAKAVFGVDDEVVLELEGVTDEVELSVWSLAEKRAALVIRPGEKRVSLGVLPLGGYGVTVANARASTAFDVLADPFDRPRYGFVVRMDDAEVAPPVARHFRRLHLNLAQFYDWAYRHSQLLPATERYLDPLGQERSLSAVNAIARGLREAGSLPLGYSAVYAVGADEREEWTDSLLVRSDGAPYRLGDDFLLLVDPAEPAWLAHYLEQLAAVLQSTEFAGFHLDQYGWPKAAQRADGTYVDLAEAYPALLEAVRDRLPAARFMFNNVNDFPTFATASSPQDATYIEVWPPHETLGDLAALATAARRLRPEHPPILSAYLACFENESEARAVEAAKLVMATVFSHGGTHLLCGEDGNVLTDPYYPRNHRLSHESVEEFVRWYDFLVRYGDLLLDPHAVDLTETVTGGINEDYVFSAPEVEFSTKAEPGKVWTRVVRTGRGIVVHLINLTGQEETQWDRGKNPSGAVSGLELRLAPVRGTPAVFHVDVESPDQCLRPIAGGDAADAAQSNSLSAGQTGVRYALPDLSTWSVLFIPSLTGEERDS